MAGCNVCNRKIQSHSRIMTCSYCLNHVHLNCLPQVTKNDSLYIDRNKNSWFCTVCTSSIFPFNHLSDDDEESFLLSISESWSSETISYDELKQQDKLFTPFDLNEHENMPLYDIDPDIQYYSHLLNGTLHNCDYYLEDGFNKSLSSLNIQDNCISMMHINIRSAVKNLQKLETYLANLNHSFQVTAVSESWLKDHNAPLYCLEGYQAEHNVRPTRGGGGVSLYIRDGIEYTIKKEMNHQNSVIESLFIEISKGQIGNCSDLIIGVIYRPPNTDIKLFNEYMLNILEMIKNENKPSYLLGDYNLNLINAENHTLTQEFLDLMYSHALFPSITKPTRVTTTSATLIDNIFCNNVYNQSDIFTGILYTDVSDHFPVFHIDYSNQLKKAPRQMKRRMYTQANMTLFSEKVRDHDWSPVLSQTDSQAAYTCFFNDYCKMYNECFPIKYIKSGYKTRKPWLTEGIKLSIKKKNKMYRNFIKTKNPNLEISYKKYRNKLNGLLFNAEKDHYDKLISENKDNMKKSWRALKDIINKKKESGASSRFMVNNRIITNKTDICNGFNSFFINVGPNLAKNIPSVNKSPCGYMKNRVVNEIIMAEVLEDEVSDLIKKLKDTSAGWDCIASSVVRKTSDHIISPLAYVFNLSITQGVFPAELKIARVIPLYKAGDPLQFSNYRPVSVLPVFSKILERLMYERLLAFVNKNMILYSYQFGFRFGHSPNLALIILIDKVTNALENGEYVLGLFLDFSKAFDTVNHAILYQKLEYYGIRGTSLDLFRSYLSERAQYVEYNESRSQKQSITCGVPQGSILGPLLFLLYINDLAQVSSKLFSLLFADDSNMFISGHNLSEMVSTMNTEMVKIVEWLQVNKLSLNLKKTHYIIFRKRRSKIVSDHNIVINGITISRTDNTKFLGVIIDDTLSFQQHIKYIKGKVARGIGILYKTKRYLHRKTLIQLYNAFIYPYLNYCIVVWGNTCKTYLAPLVKIQKRAVRLIGGARKFDHSGPIFKELKLLNINEIYVYSLQIVLYRYHHALLPDIFRGFFVSNDSIHNHNTRQSHLLHVPILKTKQAYSTIRKTGVISYNHYSTLIDLNVSIATYKYHLKRHIMDNGVLFMS